MGKSKSDLYSRLQKDRLIAPIGLVTSNLNYWGQYNNLIELIGKELPKQNIRFETVAIPYLHLVSHSIELGLKENINYLRKYSKKSKPIHFKGKWTQLNKNHSLKVLMKEFKGHFLSICNLLNIDENTIDEFNKLYLDSYELVKLLNTETPTYRYARHINSGTPVVEPKKTINLLEISGALKHVKTMLHHSVDVLSYWTDYVDFIKLKPDYKSGKGYLKIPKINLDGKAQTDQLYKFLNANFEKKTENIWFDELNKESIEVQRIDSDYYLIVK